MKGRLCVVSESVEQSLRLHRPLFEDLSFPAKRGNGVSKGALRREK